MNWKINKNKAIYKTNDLNIHIYTDGSGEIALGKRNNDPFFYMADGDFSDKIDALKELIQGKHNEIKITKHALKSLMKLKKQK